MATFDFEAGELILIDKPLTWTSFDVVKKIRNTIRLKKIGHAGTLDPLATGLLILCTGKKTKQIENYMAQEKEYTGSLVIGKTTPSVDLETEINSDVDIAHIKIEDIYKSTSGFEGEIDQVPPIYSAIRVNGERVYKKARAGEEVEIKSRKVFVREFTITKINLPELEFKIICSKGTYVRSLVRDFGEVLGVGAYLSSLRRTRIGEFKIEDAFTMESFISQVKAGQE